MMFTVFLDFYNLPLLEDLCTKTFLILGLQPSNWSFSRTWKEVVSSLVLVIRSHWVLQMTLPRSLHPQSFWPATLWNLRHIAVNFWRKGGHGGGELESYLQGLKAAEQLGEEGVIAGQGQDPFLGHGALHIIVLQDPSFFSTFTA